MIDTAMVLFAWAALSSQWGYQPADDGTMEYLIQLRPQEAQHLASSPGVEITSYVPDEAQPVGRIRIFVGDAALPQSSPQAADGAALALNDSRGRPVAAGGDAPVTETQARVARPASSGESAEVANRYAEPGDLDKDLAGPLVAIPVEQEPQQMAQRQGVEPPSPEDGGTEADEDKNTDPSAAKVAATSSSESEDEQAAAADAQSSRLPDHITNPVYTTERPGPVEAEVGLPEFGSIEQDARAARREVSPSDSPSDADDSRQGEPERSAPEDDRPWLPLAGAVAVACGFLAGNVFQWRSYLSLRKRYLNLLRTTGG